MGQSPCYSPAGPEEPHEKGTRPGNREQAGWGSALAHHLALGRGHATCSSSFPALPGSQGHLGKDSW